MGLDVLGFESESIKAYKWLESHQETDGSWHSLYHSSETNLLKETNFSSYIAVGMWHHYLNFKDKKFYIYLPLSIAAPFISTGLMFHQIYIFRNLPTIIKIFQMTCLIDQ